jgi:hypothetical protein
MTVAEQQNVVRLYKELMVLRADTRAMTYDDMRRWSLSIRAAEIGDELEALRQKYMEAPCAG